MGDSAPRLFPAEQWEQIKRVFDEVSQLPPERHAEAIAEATTDEEVRREVVTLLAIHVEAGDFLEPPAPPSIKPGDRLGPYEIEARLGGGGMGDVYRARDTRLARAVAIKVLRAGPTSPAARARFVREARAIAAVSHGNVIAIFDVGDQTGIPYLVTELLAGETLRARLDRGVPPIADAIEWARQIARGLAAAHDRGIVHRDLKPANVMLIDRGPLKLLDFGLARSTSLDRDPDVSLPGTIVGTAGYLAPEQARGEPTTTAADLFALGAILFELLTGHRAFAGDSVADTLRAVLGDEPPPPSSLRPEVPARLDRVVARCLAKDPADRFQSARDLAFVLESPADAIAPAPRRRRAVIAALAAIIVAAVVVAVVSIARTPATRPTALSPPARPYLLTHGGRDRHPAVSRDGKFLAFTSQRDGTSRIWVRELATGRETALTGGRDSAPRFSPDGQVLFTRDGDDGNKMLFRVSVLGGEPRKIADDAGDGDWSPDGRQIVFIRATRATHSVVIIDADGSNERMLAELDETRVIRGRDSDQRVRWSPDGTRVAITGRVRQPGAPQNVLLLPIDGGPPTRLPAPGRDADVSAVAWEDPDTLLYAQPSSIAGSSTGGASQIVRHHIDSGKVTTLWWSLESGIVLDRWPGHGVVLDVRSTRQNLRELRRAGDARAISSGMSIDRQPVLTPDGNKVVFTSNRGGGLLDIWAFDRTTGDTTRLTDHPGEDYDPAVTPDGRRLVWSSNRTGVFEVWTANLDGTNLRQVTRDGLGAENPTVTPDGAFVVYTSGGRGKAGVWRCRSDGTDPVMLVGDAILPEVSPDGVHVAFVTNRDPSRPTIGVARVADGAVLPFEIAIDVRARSLVLLGRSRWTRDGTAIAFVGQDADGATGVFRQHFDAAATDTSTTRTEVAGFSPELDVESFDLDDDVVILAEAEHRTEILAVTGLPR